MTKVCVIGARPIDATRAARQAKQLSGSPNPINRLGRGFECPAERRTDGLVRDGIGILLNNALDHSAARPGTPRHAVPVVGTGESADRRGTPADGC